MKKLLLLALLPICTWAMESQDPQLLIDAHEVVLPKHHALEVTVAITPSYSIRPQLLIDDVKKFYIKKHEPLGLFINSLYKNAKQSIKKFVDAPMFKFISPEFLPHDIVEQMRERYEMGGEDPSVHLIFYITTDRPNTCRPIFVGESEQYRLNMPLTKNTRIIVRQSNKENPLKLTCELREE